MPPIKHAIGGGFLLFNCGFFGTKFWFDRLRNKDSLGENLTSDIMTRSVFNKQS